MTDNDKLQWFCKEVSDNWSESVDIMALYGKCKTTFPDMDQEEIIDYMTNAIKIIGTTRKYGDK